MIFRYQFLSIDYPGLFEALRTILILSYTWVSAPAFWENKIKNRQRAHLFFNPSRTSFNHSTLEREGTIRIINLADLKLYLATIILFRLARINTLLSKLQIKSLKFPIKFELNALNYTTACKLNKLKNSSCITRVASVHKRLLIIHKLTSPFNRAA